MDKKSISRLTDIVRAARFLDKEKNPSIVALISSENIPTGGAHVITQYSFLPEFISELLCRGIVKLHAWPGIKMELLRNLGEELGSRTDGDTHFSILRRCLNEEIGLEFGTERAPGRSTNLMIKRLRSWVSNRTPHESAGALYALEASAVPELVVVGHLINLYAKATLGKVVISEYYDAAHAHGNGPWNLDRFLAAHIVDFEEGHRVGLEQVLLESGLDERAQTLFERGFLGALQAMEKWWVALGISVTTSSKPNKQSLKND